VSLKKVFYALRPASALRWLRIHPGQSTPPMDLPTLLEQSDVSDEVVQASMELIELKSVSREVGRGVFPPALVRFVRGEFEYATELYEGADLTIHPDNALRVDEFFRSVVVSVGVQGTAQTELHPRLADIATHLRAQ
jgi:hypothetical protein